MRRDGPATSPATSAVGAGAAVASGARAGARGRQAVAQLEGALDQLRALDPTALPADEVRDLVRRLGRVESRLQGACAKLVAVAEAAGLPGRDGASSTTTWLADVTDRTPGSASRTAKLARTIKDSPQLADALADGDIGSDHAASMTRMLDRGVLTDDDTDAMLREARVLPPGAFSRELRRQAQRRDQAQRRRDEQVARDRRRADWWRLDDGSLRLEAVLPPAEGDALATALEALVEPDGIEVPDEARRSPAQLRADALAELARTVLHRGDLGVNGAVLPHVTVVVPVEALAPLDEAEHLGAGGESDLGTGYSTAAVKKLLCDATVRRLVMGPQGQPLDVGRATRQWSAAQRTAIMAADGGCRGPGCDLPPARTVIHHVTWWRHDGPTSVDNGVAVCPHAHDLVHDDDWTLELDPVTRACTWTSPRGEVHVTHPRGPANARPAAASPPGQGTVAGDVPSVSSDPPAAASDPTAARALPPDAAPSPEAGTLGGAGVARATATAGADPPTIVSLFDP